MSKCVALGRLFSSNRESNHANNLDSEQRKEIVSNCILVTWCQGDLAVEPMFFLHKTMRGPRKCPVKQFWEFWIRGGHWYHPYYSHKMVNCVSFFRVWWAWRPVRHHQWKTFRCFVTWAWGHHGTNVLGNPKRTLMANNPILSSYWTPINGTRYVIHPLLNHTFLGCSIWNRGRHWLQLVCPQTLKTSENPRSYPIKSPIFIAKLSKWIWVNILPTNWWFWKHNLTKCVHCYTFQTISRKRSWWGCIQGLPTVVSSHIFLESTWLNTNFRTKRIHAAELRCLSLQQWWRLKT